MTKEDKELLLLDLSARLPYGVYCQGITKEYNEDQDAYIDKKITNILLEVHHYICSYVLVGLMDECNIETIKPYLRPMSSMTDEEKEELKQEHFKDERLFAECLTKMKNGDSSMRGKVIPHFASDWCNKNHFDYRGLIEKDLAIAVTEENNPYA